MTRPYHTVQYPIKSEPLVPTAELTPSCAGYLQPLNEPRRRTSWELTAAAIVASGLAYVGEPIVPPEDITPDKWLPLYADAAPGVAPLTAAAKPSSFGDPVQPEDSFTSLDTYLMVFEGPTIQYQPKAAPPYIAPVVEPDRWHAVYPDFTRAALRLHPAQQPDQFPDPTAYDVPEIVTLDKWFAEWARVTPPVAQPLRFEYEIDPWLLAQPELAQIDKWLPSFPEKIDSWPPQPFVDYLYAGEPIAPPVEVEMDSWFAEWAIVTRLIPQPLRFEYVYVGEPIIAAETITLDKWFVAWHQPDRPQRPAPETWYDIDAWLLTQAEAVSLDKWLLPLSEPTLPAPRVADFPAVAQEIGLVLPAPLDSWTPEFVDRTRAAPQPLRFEYVTDILPPVPVSASWAPSYPALTRQAPRAIDFRQFVQNVEPFTLSDYRVAFLTPSKNVVTYTAEPNQVELVASKNSVTLIPAEENDVSET